MNAANGTETRQAPATTGSTESELGITDASGDRMVSLLVERLTAALERVVVPGTPGEPTVTDTSGLATSKFAYGLLGTLLGRTGEIQTQLQVSHVTRTGRTLIFDKLFGGTAAQVVVRTGYESKTELLVGLGEGMPVDVPMSSDNLTIDSIIVLESRDGGAVAIGVIP